MVQPYGRCDHCGERFFAYIEGGFRCPNCDRRYTEEDLEERTT